MNEAGTRFDTKRLLWRTRGAVWDYWFVLRPASPTMLSWSDIFEEVFPESQAPRVGTEYRRGRITSPSGEVSPLTFHAAALTDATRKDTAGRPIQHFFLYLDGGERKLSRTEWALGLLAGLAPAYEVIFNLRRADKESGQDFSDRLLRTFLDELPSEIPVSSEGSAWPQYIDMGDVAVPEQRRRIHRGSEQKMSGETESVGAVSDGSFLGLFGKFFQASPPKGYKRKIAELVEQMAEHEGSEATRRLLEQLLNALSAKG